MMIRKRLFRIGQRVKIHDSGKDGGNAYPLPPGWHDGEEVTVIGFDHGYARVLGEGKETTVFIVNIDCGWEEWVDGKWRERKPCAIDSNEGAGQNQHGDLQGR